MALDLQLDRPVSSNIPKRDVPACPACESADRRLLYTVVEHEYTTTTDDEFSLKACLGCGAWYLDPRPDVGAIDIIYPPNYYAYVMEAQALEGGDIKTHGGLYKKIGLALFRMRINPIMKHLKLGPDTRWLDVGCGAGWAL
jgi:hypothetical protein